MTDVTSRIETTHRYVVSVPNPTNMTELSKAYSHVKNELERRKIEYYDDTVRVEADDEHINLSFEVKE